MTSSWSQILLCRWLRPHHFIPLLITSALTGFISGYATSVGLGKVGAVFPYISDAATLPPASCIFGLFVNMAAVFGIGAVYYRHRHFHLYNSDATAKTHVINDIAMFFGLLSCFGMMIVACFQSNEALVPHGIGAFMVFVLGNVYCGLQIYLSFKSIGVTTTRYMSAVRVTLCVVSCLTLVLTLVFMRVGLSKLRAKMNLTRVERLHWNAMHPGYAEHVTSTVCEWVVAVTFLAFMGTFYGEVKQMESEVVVRMKEKEVMELVEREGFVNA